MIAEINQAYAYIYIHTVCKQLQMYLVIKNTCVFKAWSQRTHTPVGIFKACWVNKAICHAQLATDCICGAQTESD